jgi:hypothetical protein
MNTKRFLLAVVAVFVFVNFFEMLYHQYLVGELYGQTAELWRPTETMEDYMLWMWIVYALLSVMFCYIFLKGYENKGVMEGVRYGLLIGILMAHGSFVMYAVMPIPFAMAVYWIVDALVLCTVSGAILAAVYKPA